MIKSRGLPTAIDVALPAIVSECAAMPILLAMATDASLLQPLLAVGTGMTGSALGLGMAACEGKSGACVIEVLYLPAVAVVTLRAVLAQAAIVRVVATMTGLAGAGGIAKSGVIGVTLDAFTALMLAKQREKIGRAH